MMVVSLFLVNFFLTGVLALSAHLTQAEYQKALNSTPSNGNISDKAKWINTEALDDASSKIDDVMIEARNSSMVLEGGSGSVYDNLSPKTGTDWNNYFINKYGQENVHWNLNSVDDIWSAPTRMVGYSENEMASVLGDGWTRGTYGSKGDGWKFMKDDVSVFYHPSGGKHGGAYYGISSGATGKIKVVDPNTYIPLSGDKATIIYH